VNIGKYQHKGIIIHKMNKHVYTKSFPVYEVFWSGSDRYICPRAARQLWESQEPVASPGCSQVSILKKEKRQGTLPLHWH